MLGDRAREAIAALSEELRGRASSDPALSPFAAMLTVGDSIENTALPEAPPDHPARRHLAPALRSAAGVSPRLVRAIRALAGDLRWRQVFDGAGAPPTIAEGMLAAQIAGPVGLIGAEGGCAGLFLIAPRVHYPLHTHEAAEIYYCIHGRLTLQYGTAGQPFDLTPGHYGHTPPDRVHCLTTASEPVLLIYVWVGELARPNWIWDAQPNGGWKRANWTRREDGSWVKGASEPVTEALLTQANGE